MDASTGKSLWNKELLGHGCCGKLDLPSSIDNRKRNPLQVLLFVSIIIGVYFCAVAFNGKNIYQILWEQRPSETKYQSMQA